MVDTLTADLFRPLPHGALPLADQVAAHFRELIRRGVLADGDLLPAADQIQQASRVTVLQGYRQLQKEGLVRMQRAKGTIVTRRGPQQCLALLLRPMPHGVTEQPFHQSVVFALMQQAVYHGNVPRVYALMPYHEDPERVLPPAFKADVARNEIAGVFLQPYKEGPGIPHWLRARRIPFVGLSGDQPMPTVLTGGRQFLADAAGRLLARGCRRLCVVATQAELSEAALRADLAAAGVTGELPIAWIEVVVDSTCAYRQGVHIAQQLLRQPAAARADGLVLVDDWVALGLLATLRAAGVAVPGQMRTVVACSHGMLRHALEGCERLVLDQDEFAQAIVHLLHRQMDDPQAPLANAVVPYRYWEE